MVLCLFREMAKRVPAYKIILQEHGVNPASIKNIQDFTEKVPVLDKDNYLRRFSRKELSWDGTYPTGQWNISTTSGSTGVPFYFPRQAAQDEQYARTAELYLRDNFKIHQRKTLYVVAFPMGAWIGGVFTYEALQRVARNGKYNLSVITPGINTLEIINAIKELADDFDQVIIGAYAPFLKDIIDSGTKAGIKWRKMQIGFVFSAEAFSEVFRDYIIKSVGAKNTYTTTLNHYGTVDQGTMAHETPLSILLRRTIFQKKVKDTLLPVDDREPTICQYNPEEFYFEEVNKTVLCSSYAGLPLVRYNLKDYGGTFTFIEAKNALETKKIDLKKIAKDKDVTNYTEQPFVYVYERDDLSIGYYAFRLYPDTIRRRIFSANLHATVLTGKFTMETIYDKKGTQRLNVHVEMREGAVRDRFLKNHLTKLFHTALLEDSSEYAETYKMLGTVVRPAVILHNFGAEQYFKPGAKQKWVKKDQ